MGCQEQKNIPEVHPVIAILEPYKDQLTYPDQLDPYTATIISLYDLEQKRNIVKVKKFIEWYLSHLNYPDKYGMTATIYDYEWENDREVSTETYDSVDGYSGLFLHLIYQYILLTGDTQILIDNWTKISDIVYTIAYLQASDGLTRALPNTDERYLMDNCESYAGVTAYIKLSHIIGTPPDEFYLTTQNSIKNAIFSQLYNQDTNMFDWVIEDGYKSKSNWRVFYPDAYAQIFPIYHDLLIDYPELKTHLWTKFNKKYGRTMKDRPIEQYLIYVLTAKKFDDEKL